MIRRARIRQAVQQLLSECDITEPPVEVSQIARHLGLRIAGAPDRDGLSGFLMRDSASGRCVIGVNRSHPRTRQRFTIAHEIGHFVLNHADGNLHVDADRNVRLARSTLSSEGSDRHEIEANTFAAELLMPARFLEQDMEDDDQLVDLDDGAFCEHLAKRYRVSPAAMTFRLANLGYVKL